MQDIDVDRIGRWRGGTTVSPLSGHCRLGGDAAVATCGDSRRRCRFRADTSDLEGQQGRIRSCMEGYNPTEEADQQAAVDTAFLAMMGNSSDYEAGAGGDDPTPPPP